MGYWPAEEPKAYQDLRSYQKIKCSDNVTLQEFKTTLLGAYSIFFCNEWRVYYSLLLFDDPFHKVPSPSSFEGIVILNLQLNIYRFDSMMRWLYRTEFSNGRVIPKITSTSDITSFQKRGWIDFQKYCSREHALKKQIRHKYTLEPGWSTLLQLFSHFSILCQLCLQPST